jgi:hypothetical protein
MRISCCCLILACTAAVAQNRPEATVPAPGSSLLGPEQWKSALDEWKQKSARLNLVNLSNPVRVQEAPASKPTVCAVPLVNVVPPGTQDKIPTVKPPANRRESGDTAKLPAPACEAGAFRNLPQLQIHRVNP